VKFDEKVRITSILNIVFDSGLEPSSMCQGLRIFMSMITRQLYILTLTTISIGLTSCYNDCATCVKTIGGVTSIDTVEVREVCDNKETVQLEMSSSGTTVWECE